jgi:hypothetical protein
VPELGSWRHGDDDAVHQWGAGRRRR